MSGHLRVLRDSNLVEAETGGPDARVRVYALRSEGLAELKRWLADTERLWSEQLTAFAEHVGRERP